jgi:hypothetical protein
MRSRRSRGWSDTIATSMKHILEGSSQAPAFALVVVPHTAAHTTKLSPWAIAATAAAALLILACLVWAAARRWAYEPRWTVSLKHSLAEAAWRLSASWDELRDWARLGR